MNRAMTPSFGIIISVISSVLGTAAWMATTAASASDPLPPIASNDFVLGLPGATVVINVAVNDRDSNGDLDPATVTILSTPVNGQVVVTDGGRVIYTAFPGFIGEDSFTYVIGDRGGGVSNPATVTISINKSESYAQQHI